MPCALAIVNQFCISLLYGRTGRLIAQIGGLGPGSCPAGRFSEVEDALECSGACLAVGESVIKC